MNLKNICKLLWSYQHLCFAHDMHSYMNVFQQRLINWHAVLEECQIPSQLSVIKTALTTPPKKKAGELEKI